MGVYANDGGWIATTISATDCTTSAITIGGAGTTMCYDLNTDSYLNQSRIAVAAIPPVAAFETDVAWLRRRVDEMCWRAA